MGFDVCDFHGRGPLLKKIEIWPFFLIDPDVLLRVQAVQVLNACRFGQFCIFQILLIQPHSAFTGDRAGGAGADISPSAYACVVVYLHLA